jgi:hypothetical protein
MPRVYCDPRSERRLAFARILVVQLGHARWIRLGGSDKMGGKVAKKLGEWADGAVRGGANAESHHDSGFPDPIILAMRRMPPY